MSNIITGKVIHVLDDYHIVINRGSQDNVTKNQRFLVYRLGEELIDPETGDSLGNLEIVCGEGIVDHIQERMTTLKTSKVESRKTKKIIKRTSNSSINGFLRFATPTETEEIYDPEIVEIPFNNVDTDCLVRQI